MHRQKIVSLSAEEVLAGLGEIDKLNSVRQKWESSAPAAESLPACLQAGKIREYWSYCDLPTPMPKLVDETAARILNDSRLLRLFEHTVWRTFERPSQKWHEDWPSLEQALGSEACGVFYLILALEFVPRLRERHRSWGIPEDVTRNTARQVSGFLKNYQMGRNRRLGIFLPQLAWLEKYTTNKYFRLGRLEFWANTFDGAVSAYRNKQTRETVALATDGSRFTKDGFRKANPTAGDQEGGWTAHLLKEDTTVTGCPISPRGMASREERTLALAEWECILKEGTSVLDMHIPAGGGLTPEACSDSFHRAKTFFDAFFPELRPRAIVCESWLFNTQLQDILPEDANLPVFQRQLYLYPGPSTGEDGLWFIFFQDHFDLKTAPRDTRIQRAILDFLSKGNTWRGGCMFFMLDNLPHFGTEHYRRTSTL